MIFDTIKDSGRNSVTNMIGWLSLSLIAAGWGAEFDATLRHLWASIGLFGLTAMLGLKIVHWSRLKHQQIVNESRVENDVNRISKSSPPMELPEINLDRPLIEEEPLPEEYDTLESEPRISESELISLLTHRVQFDPQLETEKI